MMENHRENNRKINRLKTGAREGSSKKRWQFSERIKLTPCMLGEMDFASCCPA